MRSNRGLFISALAIVFGSSALAQSPVAPGLDSNFGATYNLFLNFSGLDYRNVANPNGIGEWGGTNRSPGIVPAYTIDGDGTTFNLAETQAIKDTWARFANAYRGFNINVTTVDPAAAGLTDAQRIAFYDQKQYFGHTIFGGTNTWYGSAGGVSYVGTAQNANTFSGGHTNWVFPVNGTGTSAKTMSAAGIHEDGHILGLSHQRDESNGNDYSNNNGATGNGSYAPIMGTSYVSQRGTWRQGSAGINANDVARIQQTGGIGALLDDGRGHSFATATPIAVNAGGFIDVNNDINKGFIMPKASSGYTAVGQNNYTKDYFAFRAGGGSLTLTVNDGNDFLTKGTADPGATMRSVLNIYTSSGSFVGSALEDSTTLVHSFTGTLFQGDYIAEVLSYGEYISGYEPGARYFNMGGYFLTGSNIRAVPEPGTLAVIGVGALALLRRRRGQRG
ncbi:MAG: PEP-CTERM sorting domain-containing protein [Chlorobia bacterium]|nr:PEP-CTERM sorting domain-containing protein [Fimbriimonadaceae bacterium]